MAALKNLLVLALAVAAGCTPTFAGRNEGEGASAAFVEAGDLRFEALSAQPLNPGACGMFLWARAANEPLLVLAAFSEPTEARVRLRGRDRSLPRTAADGENVFGHFERQTFGEGRLQLTVDVAFDTSGRLRDGAALESGLIRIVDRSGAETIIPVRGAVACEPRG